MAEFPRQRVDELVMTRTRDDLLVYDERALALHTLNAEMASIWEACDGTRPVSHIAVLTGLELPLVNAALVKLSQADLLVSTFSSSVASHSRRRLLKQAAVGVGVAVPTIASITTPAAANHQSDCEVLIEASDECTNARHCCRNHNCAPLGGGLYTCQ